MFMPIFQVRKLSAGLVRPLGREELGSECGPVYQVFFPSLSAALQTLAVTKAGPSWELGVPELEDPRAKAPWVPEIILES